MSESNVEIKLNNVLNRIGANKPSSCRFKNAATEQANRDMILSFKKDASDFFSDYLLQEQRISSDPLLSPAGIQDKLTPIQRQFNTRLNNDICKRIITLQKLHLKKVESVFQIPVDNVSAADPIVMEMRAREVRDYLRTLPPIERISHLFRANDPFIIYALETSPAGIELIPKNVLDMGRLNRVKRKRAAELLPLMDERLALQEVIAIYNNIPSVFPWLSIIPSFLAMPYEVIPEEKEIDPVIGEGADSELMKVAAEMAATINSQYC